MADSKRDRRDHAREVAREMREAERKRRLRNRIFLQGGVAVAILAIVAVVVLVIVSANAPAGPGPKNMASGGIQFVASGDGTTVKPVTNGGATDTATLSPNPVDTADGVVQVDTYIDWACPYCQAFEASYADQLEQLTAQGVISLEIHPVSILDNSYAPSRYASRAANVAACMANFDPDQFLDVQTQFYDNQPAEGTTGLDTTAILGLVSDAGVDNADVTSCIKNETYKNWVTASTDAVLANTALADPSTGRFGTPTVTVNGERLGDISTIIDAISAASATEKGGTASPTPTDSATATQ